MANTTASIYRDVRPEDTAAALHPDLPPAASTPFVLGIAELAAHEVVASDLAEGEITVGVRADIQHLKPTPVGRRLVANATLVERDGRKLNYEIEVKDDELVVATVTHQRAIVPAAAILERLAAMNP